MPSLRTSNAALNAVNVITTMTFLNLALLGGTLAGTVPLAIHLLHRSRLKTVRWGAMLLLRVTPLQNQRRPKLEHLLLLLIRIGIPILLALCMARPVLTGLRVLTGAAPSSTLILLDNSASMSAVTSGRSSFDRAREEAAKIIRALPRGSEVAVLPLDDPDKPLLSTTVNLGTAAQVVENMNPRGGWAGVADTFEAAARLLGQMHHAQRQVILLTDFQKANWSTEDSPARLRGAERFRALPNPPKLILFNVGAGTPINVAVESLDYPKTPVGIGQKTTFKATLHNYSSQSFSDLRVVWKVDGEVRSEARVTLENKANAQTSFSHTFQETGSHFIEVSTDSDTLVADNVLRASVTVRERIGVLLVNGSPSNEPLQGETDFLSIALQPRADTQSLLAPKVIEVPALNPKALSKIAVIVLANVRSLGPQQVRELEDFIRQGGGLLVFPGSKVDSRWYNQTLFRQGEGLLPASLESLHDSTTQGRPATIAATRFDHPALELFNSSGVSLNDTAIRAWFTLQPAPKAVGDETPVTTIAPLDTGDPLFVERRFGAGNVILAAIPCSAEWSNLPTRPAFVPLMQRLVVSLSSGILPPRNLSPGNALTASFPANPSNKDPQASLLRPDGNQYWFSLKKKADRFLFETSDTLDPGLYTLTGPDGEPQHFVVNSGSKESDPELLAQKDIKEAATALKAQLVGSGDEYQTLDRESRFGQELWQLLLFLVLVLAFGEVLLQQRFRSRKGTTA